MITLHLIIKRIKKENVIKFIKVILPIFIGVYLTWYFVSNAVSPEKRSFHLFLCTDVQIANDIFIQLETQTTDTLLLYNKEISEFVSFHKPVTYDEFTVTFTAALADEVFKAPLNEITQPILVGDDYTMVYIKDLQPAITFDHFLQAFKNANYLWVFLALLVALLSHISRAYRWKYLLLPLGIKPKLSLMYHSVMIGYIINLTIPRSGEVARAGYFSKYQKTSTDKIFGTIVVERVVDLVMFGLVFMIALYLQADQDQFNQLRQTNAESLPGWVVPLFATLGVIGIIVVFAVKKIRIKVLNFLKGILEGCLTIIKLKQKVAFILHTIFIWTAYVVMLWLTALAIPEMNSIGLSAVFACFVAGTFAIGATPGGIGLYPIMIASVLIQLYDYKPDIADSFGMLMWSTQTAFMIVLGLISLIAIKQEG